MKDFIRATQKYMKIAWDNPEARRAIIAIGLSVAGELEGIFNGKKPGRGNPRTKLKLRSSNFGKKKLKK